MSTLNPSQSVPLMIDRVLAMAESWVNWNGEPVIIDGREMTPLKALRRVSDHVLDHLAEIQARVTGTESLPDHWHHSAYTTAADLAPMSGEDLNEARERLKRLAELWTIALDSIPEEALDAPTAGRMTIRELASHTAGSIVYANVLATWQQPDTRTAVFRR